MKDFLTYIKESEQNSSKNFVTGDIVYYIGKDYSIRKDVPFTVKLIQDKEKNVYLISNANVAVFVEGKDLVKEEEKNDSKMENEIKVGTKIIFKRESSRYNGNKGEITKIDPPLPGKGRYTIRVKSGDGRLISIDNIDRSEFEIDQSNKNRIELNSKVIYHCNKTYYLKFDGKEGIVSKDYGDGEFEVFFPEYTTHIVVNSNELELINDDVKKPTTKTIPVGSISSTTTEPVKTDNDFQIGDRVIATGREGNFVFEERYGVVKKVEKDRCMVEFEEVESKNLSKILMVVSKDILKKTGEKVEVEKPKPSTNWTKTTPPKKEENVKTDEDEEEEDEEDVSVAGEEDEEEEEELKKEDLQLFNFGEYFDPDKIVTKEEFLQSKKSTEEKLNQSEIKPLKKIFLEKSVKTHELILQYYEFLENKISEGLPVYRYLGEIDDEDLIDLKTKVRASDSKELTKKYSFDSGIIVFWKMMDAVIFKTL